MGHKFKKTLRIELRAHGGRHVFWTLIRNQFGHFENLGLSDLNPNLKIKAQLRWVPKLAFDFYVGEPSFNKKNKSSNGRV